MVKPEYKGDKPRLLPSESSEDSNMDAADHEEHPMVAKSGEEGTVIVTFDESRSRKGPRICVFVGLFVFVLVVGFLAVYLIGRTHGNNREHARGANMADDMAKIPTRGPTIANSSKLWQKNASWETHEELFQLSDAIGSSDIIGLRPVYRKDLPSDYIAYWEVKLNGKTGEKYVIISAAKETGDHRLAQEGALPSPLDIMTESAQQFGYNCHKVYRLTPDGLMMCEDRSLKRIVAATRDIDTDSEFQEMRWRRLDKQVKRALPRFKKAWTELAKRVTKLPQWNRFQWLSMKSGQKPTRKSSRDEDLDDDDDHDDDDDDEVEELGVKPGEMFKIPLGPGIYPEGPCRIKFAGLRNSRIRGRKGKTWLTRWQRRLCRVLDDACEGTDLTRVKQRYFKQSVMGDRYVKLQIRADTRYVRRQLQGQEVRFRIEVRTNRNKIIIINYGIILKHSRKGRSAQGFDHVSIPYRQWFPSYKQHRYGQCMTGSAAVAWGMVLGYMDNLAHRAPAFGYPKTLLGLFPDSRPVSLSMNKHVRLVIEKIFDKLGSARSNDGSAETSPAKMKRMAKWLRAYNLHLMVEEDTASRQRATARAVKLLKHGFPVIVSKERGEAGHHHYSVATQLRQRTRYYRTCRRGKCPDFQPIVENEIFVHPGLGVKGNKWENADTFFTAAIMKR